MRRTGASRLGAVLLAGGLLVAGCGSGHATQRDTRPQNNPQDPTQGTTNTSSSGSNSGVQTNSGGQGQGTGTGRAVP